MKRGGTKLAWLFLITLACVSAWFVLAEDSSPELPMASASDDTPAPVAPTPAPTRDKADPQDIAPAPVVAEDGQPAAEAPATVAAPQSEEPLWQPAYGDALRRGGARATFALVDAQGAALESPRVTVKLHRALGPYWLREHAEVNTDSGVVECIGHSSVGLEPGEYELEVHDARYGGLRHRFALARGQQLEQTLRLPNWRRVVSFRFVDQHGNPVPWIHRAPSVSCVADPLLPEDRTNAPGAVMRDPPTFAAGGLGGSGGRFGGNGHGSHRARPHVVPTDAGIYYVAVIAGAACEVKFELDESLWGKAGSKHDGRFGAPFDASQEIGCSLAWDFMERTTELPRIGAADPGKRSLLLETRSQLPTEHGLPSGQRGLVQVFLKLDAPTGVVPQLFVNRDPLGDSGWLQSMTEMPRGWVATVPQGASVFLYFTDNELFQSAAEELELDGCESLEIWRTVSPPGFGLGSWSLSPTVSAWAVEKSLDIAFEPAKDNAKWLWDIRRTIPIQSRVYCNADLLAEMRAAPRTRVESSLSGHAKLLGTHEERSVSYDARCEVITVGRAWFAKPLHVRVQSKTIPGAEFVSGTFSPPVPQRGIAFRAIGPMGEGLPWVDASLLTLEEDQFAQQVRDHEAAETRDHRRPRFSQVTLDYYSNLDDADADAPLADILPQLPEGMRGRLKAREELLWYARNGTWYSTHRKFRSDDHGYVIDIERELTPGARYVLYLWSNSRDDMRPDRRIVFEAAPGLTDLGALPLPAYTD